MKKFMIGFLVLGSFSVFAGSITNKGSVQTINFDTVKESGETYLIVDGTAAGYGKRTILLGKFRASIQESSENRDSNFEPVYTNTERCSEKPCAVALVPVFVFDTVLLPVTLPLELIHSANVRSDLNKISKAVGVSKATGVHVSYNLQVNPISFKRIVKLLELE